MDPLHWRMDPQHLRIDGGGDASGAPAKSTLSLHLLHMNILSYFKIILLLDLYVYINI